MLSMSPHIKPGAYSRHQDWAGVVYLRVWEVVPSKGHNFLHDF